MAKLCMLYRSGRILLKFLIWGMGQMCGMGKDLICIRISGSLVAASVPPPTPCAGSSPRPLCTAT